MVNRARRQFVAVIMGILLIVFFCMGAAIILTAETTQKEKIKNMLNPFDTTAKFNGYRRFVLGCSWSGTFVVDANAGKLFTTDEIENIFRFIYERENFSVYLENPPAHGTESWGEYEDYFYRINFVEDGFLICVIDGSPAQALTDQVILSTVLCSLIALAVLFVIVYFLSYWIVKPIDEALKKQQQFISDASHELKTPLTIISANTDILQNDYGEVQWLSNIRQQTARMNAMVGEMLNLAKLQEDAPLVMSDFNLSSAVLNSVLPFDCVAFEKHKLLDTNIEPGITYHGDEGCLKKAVTILVDNALKYASDGGEVRVSLKTENNRPVLAVYNTGCTMDEKDKNHIFERFYRKDSSRNSQTGGSGLGLAILKAMADKNKWKLSVQLKTGEYTKFIMIL